MNAKRLNLFPFLLIALVALPGFGTLVLYKMTNNPHLQPLGLTQEGLQTYDAPEQVLSIEVKIRYGVERQRSPSRQALRQSIARAFSGHTTAFHFNMEDMRGDDIDVTFSVGPNAYGPFSLGAMNEGMLTVLDAQDYAKEANDR